ncbi:sensor histidine kinase [Fulvivirga sediminis]|uniref:histidine kinase n=1 Tax=Fulvivirga sediminis TaxID=2803949 RepID=A0A937F709_9BACT|nr:HAMP domain-containing sensor histidine kinase [Fulvivirga sediminis]MBL3655799.1 HAMP domain-containing histidine kinase [Fulvivirga sediminis]
MKLLNYTTKYLAGVFFLILIVWAGLLYYALLDEIYDSMDDGLENQKLLVLEKASNDKSVLGQNEFEDGYYTIKPIVDPGDRAYRDIYSDTTMFMQNEQDFEPVRLLTTVFKRDGKWYELRLITSMVEEDDLIEDLAFGLLWLYVGVLATILILNNLLLKKIWKPFYNLIKQLSGFRLDKPEQIKGDSKIEEFNALYESVNTMLNANIEAYAAQKQFIENASHELQTPMGIIRSRLELLLQKGDLSDSQLKEWKVIMDNVNRMGRLNRSLLLLAKIENRQFEEAQKITVNQTIDDILLNLQALFEHKEIEVDKIYANEVVVHANAELVYTLFNNLIKNAINHSDKEGHVKVMISGNIVTIENSGEAPLPVTEIFKRFYKSNAASQSTGLGLSIVKAIADRYHYEINYRFANRHIFEIVLIK